MKQEIYDSLGFEVPVMVPETVEEYNKLAGDADACRATAVDHEVYHNFLTNFRRKFVEELRKVSEVPFLTITQKDKEGKDVEVRKESDNDYVNRIRGLKNLAADSDWVSTYGSLSLTVAQSLTLDLKPEPRKPKTPPKGALAAADSIIAAGKADFAASKLTTELGRTITPDRDSLAFAIRDRELAREKARAAALVGELTT